MSIKGPFGTTYYEIGSNPDLANFDKFYTQYLTSFKQHQTLKARLVQLYAHNSTADNEVIQSLVDKIREDKRKIKKQRDTAKEKYIGAMDKIKSADVYFDVFKRIDIDLRIFAAYLESLGDECDVQLEYYKKLQKSNKNMNSLTQNIEDLEHYKRRLCQYWYYLWTNTIYENFRHVVDSFQDKFGKSPVVKQLDSADNTYNNERDAISGYYDQDQFTPKNKRTIPTPSLPTSYTLPIIKDNMPYTADSLKSMNLVFRDCMLVYTTIKSQIVINGATALQPQLEQVELLAHKILNWAELCSNETQFKKHSKFHEYAPILTWCTHSSQGGDQAKYIEEFTQRYPSLVNDFTLPFIASKTAYKTRQAASPFTTQSAPAATTEPVVSNEVKSTGQSNESTSTQQQSNPKPVGTNTSAPEKVAPKPPSQQPQPEKTAPKPPSEQQPKQQQQQQPKQQQQQQQPEQQRSSPSPSSSTSSSSSLSSSTSLLPPAGLSSALSSFPFVTPGKNPQSMAEFDKMYSKYWLTRNQRHDIYYQKHDLKLELDGFIDGPNSKAAANSSAGKLLASNKKITKQLKTTLEEIREKIYEIIHELPLDQLVECYKRMDYDFRNYAAQLGYKYDENNIKIQLIKDLHTKWNIGGNMGKSIDNYIEKLEWRNKIIARNWWKELEYEVYNLFEDFSNYHDADHNCNHPSFATVSQWVKNAKGSFDKEQRWAKEWYEKTQIPSQNLRKDHFPYQPTSISTIKPVPTNLKFDTNTLIEMNNLYREYITQHTNLTVALQMPNPSTDVQSKIAIIESNCSTINNWVSEGIKVGNWSQIETGLPNCYKSAPLLACQAYLPLFIIAQKTKYDEIKCIRDQFYPLWENFVTTENTIWKCTDQAQQEIIIKSIDTLKSQVEPLQQQLKQLEPAFKSFSQILFNCVDVLYRENPQFISSLTVSLIAPSLESFYNTYRRSLDQKWQLDNKQTLRRGWHYPILTSGTPYKGIYSRRTGIALNKNDLWGEMYYIDGTRGGWAARQHDFTMEYDEKQPDIVVRMITQRSDLNAIRETPGYWFYSNIHESEYAPKTPKYVIRLVSSGGDIRVSTSKTASPGFP